MQNAPHREKRRVKKVFTIVEKPGQDKGFWLEIGVAFENRDGSLNVKLDALPTNGTIHIREQEQRKPDSYRQNGDRAPSNGWQQNGGTP